MNLSELLAWQWNNYHKAHRSRLNLIIHIITVPVFIVGVLSLIGSLFTLNFMGVLASMAGVALAFGGQGIGHAKESVAAEPFTSTAQAVVRILIEQFITFPRFVLCGGWYAAFNTSE